MKKRIVISGVNMVEGGILTILKDVMDNFDTREDFDVICLVHKKELFRSDLKNIKILEFPDIKESWLKRLWFEYVTSYFLSKKIKADAWICLHDVTANVISEKKYVYCHNPTPFYKSSLKDFKLDKKFYIFTKLYKFLYMINIKRNTRVIVQQNWIAHKFNDWYKLDNLLVAKPEARGIINSELKKINKIQGKIKLLYPAVPRVFKNFDLIVKSLSILREKKTDLFDKIEVELTFFKGMNKVGDEVIRVCEENNLKNINFIGFLNKEELAEKYRQENCILLFPSKLETWGLPLSEAKEYSLPILVSDLQYAYETINKYPYVCYFNPDDEESFIESLERILNGQFDGNREVNEDFMVINNWEEFVNLVNEDIES